MAIEPEALDATGAIREVETELDRLLARRREEIEAALDSRIRQEREAAMRQLQEVEREISRGKDTVTEFEAELTRMETERREILEEIRGRIDRALGHQTTMENLAKRTTEEIRAIHDLHLRLEDLRQKTAERAGFLKADLRERFGIVAEVPQGPPDAAADAGGLNLDQELEKLRQIKALLKLESAGEALGPEGDASPESQPESVDPGPMPELSDLIAAGTGAASEEPETPAPDAASPLLESAAPAAAAPGPQDGPAPAAAAEDEIAAGLGERLAALHRTEPANGSGEIPHYLKGTRAVLDGRGFLHSAARTIEEARRLMLKLGLTESPKEQFFIKQELINWQEGLRKMVQRAVWLCDKKGWSLPSHTRDVLSLKTLKELEDDLGFANWSQSAEFDAFEARFRNLQASFEARLTPLSTYQQSLLSDLSAED